MLTYLIRQVDNNKKTIIMKRHLLLMIAALFTSAAVFAEYNKADYPIIVPWASKPYCDYYDTVEYAAALGMTVEIKGEAVVPTHENAIGKPATTPTEEDWNNIENWVTFPVTVQIPKEEIAEGENPYYTRTYNDSERGRDGFRHFILAADNKIAFPPYEYSFKIIAKKSCKLGTNDHIYGENCKCINCDATREHYYSFINDNQCARCINEFDEWKYDDDGNEVLTGDTTGEMCGAKITRDSAIEYQDYEGAHSGWHKEETDSEEYNCSCECGYYAYSYVKLAHTFDEDAGWQQTNKDGLVDPLYHWKDENCQRCQEADRWISEEHSISNVVEKSRQAGDSVYIDFSAHEAPGVCDKCGFKGVMREPHTFADDGSCYCKYCGKYVHNWDNWHCGDRSNYTCKRCGQNYSAYTHYGRAPDTTRDFGLDSSSDGENYHQYGDIIYIDGVPDPDEHKCKCGQTREKHYFYDDYYNGDKCFRCGYELTDDDNQPTSDNKEGDRGVNCVKQEQSVKNHLGIKASTTHFNATCPSSKCGAVFDDNPLGSGSNRSTFKKRAAEYGVDSIDDMPMRAYVKCTTGKSCWMARMNWTTTRNYDLIALHDTWGWNSLDDILETANDAMDLIYANGVANGLSSMTLCLNAFGVERPVTNSFTGKITTTIGYSQADTFKATGTVKEKARHNGTFIEWK